MRRLAGIAVCVATLAPAASAQQRDPREIEAKKACLAGRPERGIELLAELYAETNNATYIYNQARCFQQNGRAPDAVARFREYLRKAPSVDPAEQAQVQGYIAELEAQIRQSPPASRPVAATTPPPAPATAVRATTATPEETPEPSPSPSPSPSSTPSAYKWRLAGVLTGSVGALALIGGLYMGMRVKNLTTEVTNDATNHTFSQSKYDEGRRDQTLQWVGYGVGAAGVLGGVALYLLGGRSPDERAPVTAMPTIGPELAGGTVRILF